MKKVLILGINGMLGNALWKYLFLNKNLLIHGTKRNILYDSDNIKLFDVDYDYIGKLEKIITQGKYDYIINCIGYIRPQDTNIEEQKKTFLINSHLPKTLQLLAYIYKYKLIHISTDCVFDGKDGNYKNDHLPNEFGIYGFSKYLGEIYDQNNLTLRTSIIGFENIESRNLLNWFLNLKKGDKISGYSNVFRNGITTLTLAKIIENIIIKNNQINGLIQIGGDKIDKYSLLILFNEIFEKNIYINKNTDIKSNKVILPSIEQNIYFSDLILPIKEQILELKEFYLH